VTNRSIERREFITLLAGSAAAWPLAARAQQPAMPVIGVLYGVSAADWTEPMSGFQRGLNEAGFIDGRNVAIEYRWADGHYDRLPGMAADLVGRKVAVILSGGSDVAIRSAIAATKTIPIVFTTASDPVAVGHVASLNRPGANATGITLIATELGPKRIELLREVVPAATKIALLVNPTNPVMSQAGIDGAQTGARHLGLEIIIVNASTTNEIETAFATAVQQRATALIVATDAYLTSRRDQIAALVVRHALPTIAGTRDSAVAGQLMSYGPNQADMYRQAGVYVGRILKGEKPADLPVVQPTRFELVVNLKTAKAIGLTIPETFLVRADEVIE
jgi:putative tryptophan/tyrosine transport system substrate-binding protein